MTLVVLPSVIGSDKVKPVFVALMECGDDVGSPAFRYRI